MSTALARLSAFIRWKDWASAKLPLLLSVAFYALLAGRLFTWRAVADCLLFALLAAVSSVFGYLVNDLGDVRVDRLQGKRNAFARWPASRAAVLVAGFAALGAILTLPLIRRPGVAVLWLAWMFIATAYSLPPLRLKERSALGLVAPAVAQQVLPVLLALATFDMLRQASAWLFVAYAFSKGLALILIHQRRDLPSDAQSDTRTFAVRHGERAVTRAARIALELEKALFWGPLALAVHASPSWPVAGVRLSLAWPLLLLYAPIYGLSVAEAWRGGRRGTIEDPYHTNPLASATGYACVVWPTIGLPFYLVGLLATAYPPAGLLVAVCIVLMVRYVVQLIQHVQLFIGRRAVRDLIRWPYSGSKHP